jgi:phage terminase Nu1 subunit (DNA packaging protein)
VAARSADPSKIEQKELAKRLGLTSRQIHNLVEAGMPRVMEGTKAFYPWPESNHWYLKHKIDAAQAAGKSKTEKNAELADRKLEIEVRRAELDLGREEGSLVTIDYMEQQLEAMLQRLRAKLLNFPAKWAPALVGMRSIAEAQARLEPALHEAMEALTETGEDPELDALDDDIATDTPDSEG